MGERPGFLIYHDDYHALTALDDASFHRVMDAACEYSETGDISGELHGVESVIFAMMKNSLDRDFAKYQKRVDAGRRGGLAKAGKAKESASEASKSWQNLAEPSKSWQNLANSSKSTNSNSNSNSNSNPNSNANANSMRENSLSQGDGVGERVYPAVSEVQDYAERIGLEVNAVDFVRWNEARNWTDGNGQPIRNWRMWLENFPGAMRKEDKHESTAEPDRTGQRDEYGGLYL